MYFLQWSRKSRQKSKFITGPEDIARVKFEGRINRVDLRFESIRIGRIVFRLLSLILYDKIISTRRTIIRVNSFRVESKSVRVQLRSSDWVKFESRVKIKFKVFLVRPSKFEPKFLLLSTADIIKHREWVALSSLTSSPFPTPLLASLPRRCILSPLSIDSILNHFQANFTQFFTFSICFCCWVQLILSNFWFNSEPESSMRLPLLL